MKLVIGLMAGLMVDLAVFGVVASRSYFVSETGPS